MELGEANLLDLLLLLLCSHDVFRRFFVFFSYVVPGGEKRSRDGFYTVRRCRLLMTSVTKKHTLSQKYEYCTVKSVPVSYEYDHSRRRANELLDFFSH